MKMIINRLLPAGLLLAAIVSCQKEAQEDNLKEAHASTCTITASFEESPSSKTVIQEGKEVYWTQNDKLQVYAKDSENNLKRFQFVAEKGAASKSRKFTCDTWDSQYTPVWATSLDSYLNTDGCTLDGVIGTNINPTQNISNAGSYGTASSALVGQVEPSEEDYTISEMKNVPAVLSFKVSTPNIKQIVISAPGGEKVAGKVNVDWASLTAGKAEFFTVTSGADEITAAPSGSSKVNDCFALVDDAPTAYCVCLLPQTYSRGLRFVLTDKDGKVAVRTVGASSGLTLERNVIRTFSSGIDEGLTFREPETTHDDIVLGFENATSNPFTGLESNSSTCKEDDAFTQTREGVQYEYVSVGTAQAYWSGGGLMIKTNGGFLRLPYIDGYKLSSVTLGGGNADGKRAAIFKGLTVADATQVGSNRFIASENKGKADGSSADNAKQEYTWTLTDDYESGALYYIKATSASVKIVKMVLTYTYVGGTPD